MARKPNNQQVARAGESFVAAELHRRGAYAVTFAGSMPIIDVLASNIEQTRTVSIQVKTKTARTWQTTIARGAPREPENDPQRFWVLVDLAGAPDYYVAPEWWVQNDIYTAHQEYLARHGGTRAVNPESKHHAIPVSRVDQWRDCWELLGIV